MTLFFLGNHTKQLSAPEDLLKTVCCHKETTNQGETEWKCTTKPFSSASNTIMPRFHRKFIGKIFRYSGRSVYVLMSVSIIDNVSLTHLLKNLMHLNGYFLILRQQPRNVVPEKLRILQP